MKKAKIIFPAGLLLEHQRHLVIGPNDEGLRKARIGLDAQCKVAVIGTDPVPGIVDLARRKKIVYLNRRWRPSDISPDNALIISCLPDDEDNHQISRLCIRQRILVNILDRPPLCTFFAPGMFRVGGLTFAVFGGGLTPILLQQIRKDLQKRYGHLADVHAAVADLRRQLKRRIPLEADRRRLAAEIVSPRYISKLSRLPTRRAAILETRKILNAKLSRRRP